MNVGRKTKTCRAKVKGKIMALVVMATSRASTRARAKDGTTIKVEKGTGSRQKVETDGKEVAKASGKELEVHMVLETMRKLPVRQPGR